MVRFSWTQLTQWEHEALRRVVPQNVPGLTPKSIASNYRWLLRAKSFERNGGSANFQHLSAIRIGFFTYVVFFLYQQLRVVTFGITELQEHHSLNYDNIVYDKLSTRCAPYHSPQNFP
jgi:hypothetical protein